MAGKRNRKPGESTKDSGKRSREQQTEERIDRLLNPQKYAEEDQEKGPPSWDTEKDLPEGEKFTLEELVSMRPFRDDDPLETQIAFRSSSKLLRGVQRIKERAGPAYDIMSDLHRDIYMLGLIIMTQRFEEMLGGEVLISKALGRVKLGQEIVDQVSRLARAIYEEDESDRNADYLAFVQFIRTKPYIIKVKYVTAMENNPLLSELRKRMTDLMSKSEHDDHTENV